MVERSFSIGTKMIVLVLAVSIVSIAITTVLAFNLADTIIKNDVRESLKAESDARGTAVSEIIETHLSKLESLSDNLVIQEKISELIPSLDDVTFKNRLIERHEAISEEVKNFQLNEFEAGLKELKIINPTGKLIYSLSGNEELADYVTTPLRSEKTRVTFIQDDEKNRLLEYSIPIILKGDTHLQGKIVATTYTSALDNILLNRYGLQETGEVYIVNDKRLMVSESLFFENAPFSQNVDSIPVESCFANGENVDGLVYEDYRGVDIFGVSHCKSDLGFVLLTEVDESVILRPVNELQNDIIIVGLTLMGIVAVVTFVLSKRITNPILKLRDATHEISSGNFDVRTEIKTKDEIGELSSSFDSMAETIQDSLSAITRRENIIKRQDELLLKVSEEKQDSCVCLIDLVGSLKITESLSEEQTKKYFEIFTNPVLQVIKKYQGITLKIIDDAVLFYFPISKSNSDSFSDIIKCCLEISNLNKQMNEKLEKENLPGIAYRISSTFGTVNVTKAPNSSYQDIFGEPANICFKINQYALPNTLVIEKALYEKVKELKEFKFTKLDKILISGLNYEVYLVSKK